MKVSTDKNAVKELLSRSVDTVYPTRAALERELLSGRRLRVYLGIDPTGAHLHLGHATNLLLLRRFQDLGHESILLIGDFTARIGDPTDKLAARQPLTTEQIESNLKTFKKQAAKIVRFGGENPARIEFNSTWHDKMTFGELIKLAQHFTVQQIEERDMFEARRKEGKPIGLHEFLYPLSQGYDSVALDVDVEIGGTDQTFNMLAGRTLMKALKQKEKFVMTTKLLVDPATGKKIMNKSEGGLVNLDDLSNDMFGKVMALADSAIFPVAEFSTTMPIDEVRALDKEKNPRDAKLRVAHEVVKTYHSAKEADAAREEWVRVFSKKGAPEEALALAVPRSLSLIELVLASGIKSKSEARRLIAGNAVSINGAAHSDPNEVLPVKGGETLKIGKHRFFTLEVK
ncbi:MAG: tyrosine--tRNA ligase, partial [Patescibacteria group bacterium]